MRFPQHIPPKPNELEISVFGPGFGESIVAHLGNGHWVIVDSCVSVLKYPPKPVEYLTLLGLNPKDCVRVVVATHWHDDHVAGLSEALKVCENAIFCCSHALTSKDFLNLAELYRESSGALPPGPSEIRSAIEIAAQRSKQAKINMLCYAKSDGLIWRSPDNSAKIVSLSPSDEMNRRSIEFMACEYKIATTGNVSSNRLLPGTPNDTASALRIDVEGRSILLGSDLESGKDALIGWSAVLTSQMGLEEMSSVFKVAHHGSKTGHHDSVWSRMLEERPWAFITPFRWGCHRIPTLEDRTRILSLTDKVFLTADPDRDAPPAKKRSPKVEALIRQTTKQRRSACGPVGHIRWRAPISNPSDQGTVELFDGALYLGKGGCKTQR